MDEIPANRLRLMIVENDRVTARDLEATLRRRGFEVLGIASSAGQALDLLKGGKPDLVLLDIQLDHDEDGITLAQTLREQHGIPSIFITGYSEEAIIERARRARPVAFLRKPFSDNELAVCLESVVERRLAGERLSLRLPGLDAVSRQLPQAVIGSDLDGNVVYLNPAALALTGWTFPEAENRPLSEIIPLAELAAERSEPIAVSGKTSRRVTLKTRSGAFHLVEERSVPIRASDGEAIGLVTVLVQARSVLTPTTSPAPTSAA